MRQDLAKINEVATKIHLLQSRYADGRLPSPIGRIGSEAKNP